VFPHGLPGLRFWTLALFELDISNYGSIGLLFQNLTAFDHRDELLGEPDFAL